ncbi:HipA family kinase [Glutamicibacter sp. PAEs-4]|uniref:HipA family kinase n=1 Tax=Glutamicibacter sp. PAEs-4 TaxID=3444114 RepID=UPI003EB9BB1A
MARRGLPGLAVYELIASELGSKDLQQGKANVFVKSDEDADHPVVLHEYMAARLAHSMGIPVPFGELATIQRNAKAWATAIIGAHGEVSAPPNPLELSVAEPHIYAGIAVFDAWLLNIDRTDVNLIWTPDVGLWAIDHEQCFNGVDPRLPDALKNCTGLVHCSQVYREAPPQPDLMQPWIDLIRSHGKRWINSACDAAVQRGLSSRARADQYRRFLTSRAQDISYLSTQTYKVHANDLFSVWPMASDDDGSNPCKEDPCKRTGSLSN